MKVSVILPVKNQSDKLLRHLEEKIIPYFDNCGLVYEILIQSDGSNEQEEKKLEEGLKKMPLQVKHLPFSNKKGKGHAVKEGILAASGDYVLFMDADLATDLSAFDLMKKELGKYDAYIGSRELKDSKIAQKQTFIRRITHFGSKVIIRMMFHLKGITDTQCGFKMFKTDVAKLMAKHQTVDGFAFDVEYLYFLSLNHFSVKEVPVIWTNDADSSVSAFSSSVNFFKALWGIKRKKKTYLLTEQERATLKK